jgi:hypothetical protein
MKTRHGANLVLVISALMIFVLLIACSYGGDDSGFITTESVGKSVPAAFATVVVENERSVADQAAGGFTPPRAEPTALASVTVSERGDDSSLAFGSDEEG